MTEPVIVEIDPDDVPAERRLPGRLLWPAVALVVLALVAVLVGRAQHPSRAQAPTAQHLGTTVVWSGSVTLSIRADGFDLLSVEIENLSGNTVTISDPQVVIQAGVSEVEAVFVDPRMTGLPSQDRWDYPIGDTTLVLPASGIGTLDIRYHLGCPAVGAKAPFITAIHVAVTAGPNHAVRDVSPDVPPDGKLWGRAVCPSR